jgi:predicted AAA+ superfamily ATPase
LSGGLPEIINEPDSMKIDKYISDLIMDKVIFIDIPAVFKIEEPALLKELFKIISSNPGMICDYESLANDLKRDRKTISNYLLYLEKAFLIRKIYNYSNNALTSEKRLKRFYPSSSAFCYLFSDVEIGKIVETGFLMNLDINFFSRSGEREIDFIMLDKKKINPIEIKYRNKIKISEFSELIRFCHKNDLKSAFILTKDYKSEEIFEQVTLKFIPISEWLVIR